METQKIQATITLELTTEQLLTLLNSAPTVPTPMPQTAPAPIPQQTPVQQPVPQQTLAQMFPTMPTTQPMPYQNPQPAPQMQAAPMPTAQPIPQTQPTPAPMPAQTAPQTYSVQELTLAARPLMESGRQQELIALIAEFGVPSMSAIPQNRTAEFAARLRAMGGQI